MNRTQKPSAESVPGSVALPRRSRNTQMMLLTTIASWARTSLYTMRDRREIGAVNSRATSAGGKASAVRSPPNSHTLLSSTTRRSGASAALVGPNSALAPRAGSAAGRKSNHQK